MLVDFPQRCFRTDKNAKTGDISSYDGKRRNRKQVEEKIKATGLDNSYKILHDWTDVAEILQDSDAVVFPSISEGLGIAMIEIQAAGLPCAGIHGRTGKCLHLK